MSRVESGTESDSFRQVRQVRSLKVLPPVGVESVAFGLGLEGTSWNFHSRPLDVEGRTFYGSRLGDIATAPNVAYDGVPDVDADRPALG